MLLPWFMFEKLNNCFCFSKVTSIPHYHPPPPHEPFACMYKWFFIYFELYFPGFMSCRTLLFSLFTLIFPLKWK